MRFCWLCWLFLMVACSPQPPSISLYPGRAAVGEGIEIRLLGLEVSQARVSIGGTEATVTRREGDRIYATVPNLPGGPQEVVVQSAGREARASLGVLGRLGQEVEAGVALVSLPPGASLSRLEGRGFSLLERGSLGSTCARDLVRVGFDKPLGQALAELESLDPEYKADPESLWNLGGVDGPGAVEAPAAHGRGHRGSGVAVAVLDTGVDESIPQLPGYDFVEDDPIPQDAFPEGHGTGAAHLVRGVAPEAQILPLRVCDENGICKASRVVRGVCWVLDNAQGPTVLSLSLGGSVPVELLRAVLALALEKGYPVAAAAGNQGQHGSPTHYPAAFPLPGLVAVGALQQTAQGWAPAPYSTQGAYVDLAAPGTGLICAQPGGGMGTCTGTSFATPLVAGAMAVWLSAQPGLSPAQLEQELKNTAKLLPYPPQAVGGGMLDLSQKP